METASLLLVVFHWLAQSLADLVTRKWISSVWHVQGSSYRFPYFPKPSLDNWILRALIWAGAFGRWHVQEGCQECGWAAAGQTPLEARRHLYKGKLKKLRWSQAMALGRSGRGKKKFLVKVYLRGPERQSLLLQRPTWGPPQKRGDTGRLSFLVRTEDSQVGGGMRADPESQLCGFQRPGRQKMKETKDSLPSKVVSDFCFSRCGHLSLPLGRTLFFKSHLRELFSYMDTNPNSFPDTDVAQKGEKTTTMTTSGLGRARVTQRPNSCFQKMVGRAQKAG